MKNLAEHDAAAITGGVGLDGDLPLTYTPLSSGVYIASILALLEPRWQAPHISD